jgi:hypothetical protein
MSAGACPAIGARGSKNCGGLLNKPTFAFQQAMDGFCFYQERKYAKSCNCVLSRVVVCFDSGGRHNLHGNPAPRYDADRVIVEIPQTAPFVAARNALLNRLQVAGVTLHARTKLTQPIRVQMLGFAFYDAWHFSATNPQRGNHHGSP